MVEKKKLSLNDKLDLILKNQEKILKQEGAILDEEKKLEEMEVKDLENDDLNYKTEEEALKELKKLERELKKNVSSPLKNITKRDLIKGFVGSFVGVMSHFTFSKALAIAETLEIWRASILYVVAFFIIMVMLYYSGFRNVKKEFALKFMPVRAIVLYSVSIVTILLINLLFGKIHFPVTFGEIYTLVGASIILGVMGAGTADLIGREEH